MNFKNAAGKIPFVHSARLLLNKINTYMLFYSSYQKFRQLSLHTQNRFILHWKDRCPCLFDNTAATGFDRHYIYHTAWAARALAMTKPEFHIDISSSLYFCAIVSAFIPIKYYDYRPANLQLNNLTSKSADLLKLPFGSGSVESLSCMHVIEHMGLGRYGDPLDPDGDLKAIAELKRVLSVGGSLLFVVPVGKSKIMFNAHRIYSYEQIINYFEGLHLKEFALIPERPEDGGLLYNVSKKEADSQAYGCGCFWFIKE